MRYVLRWLGWFGRSSWTTALPLLGLVLFIFLVATERSGWLPCLAVGFQVLGFVIGIKGLLSTYREITGEHFNPLAQFNNWRASAPRKRQTQIMAVNADGKASHATSSGYGYSYPKDASELEKLALKVDAVKHELKTLSAKFDEHNSETTRQLSKVNDALGQLNKSTKQTDAKLKAIHIDGFYDGIVGVGCFAAALGVDVVHKFIIYY